MHRSKAHSLPAPVGRTDSSLDNCNQELRVRIERLEKARDALRRKRPPIGPDVTASEVADCLDAELTRLVKRLRDVT